MPTKPDTMKKTITEIEIETRETLIVSFPRRAARPLCSVCGANQMLTPDEACVVTRMNLRAIFRLVEANAIHFHDDNNGMFYICAASLADKN